MGLIPSESAETPSEVPAGTLERGLQLLGLFTVDRPQWTLRELREQTFLAKATVRRLMLTLERLGWVEQLSDGGIFTLGPQMLQAQFVTTSTTRLIARARPHLERLARSTTESALLSTWGHDGTITLDMVSTPRLFRPFTSVGALNQGLETADAQVLVAFAAETVWAARAHAQTGRSLDDPESERLYRLWREVRRAGVAYDREGWRAGVCAVAAPIVDATGRVLGSVSVVVPSERGHNDQLHRLAEAVRTAATDIGYANAGDEDSPAS